jgi:hypothetical protein
LINKKKYAGFPRENGHCKFHDVSKTIRNLGNLLDLAFNDLLYLPWTDECKIVLDIILNELIDSEVDLVRGDIVSNGYTEHNIYDEGFCIYDGCKLVTLEHCFPFYDYLPRKFNIITNGVPIGYWDNKYDDTGNIILFHGFIDAKYYWLDVDIHLREELINNARNDGKTHLVDHFYDDGVDDIVYTQFIFDNKQYYIICNQHTELQRLINILSTKDKLFLEYEEHLPLFLFISLECNEDVQYSDQ